MVQVLRSGYIIPFHSPPPLSLTPIPLPSYTPSSIRGIALAAAVKDLLSKGAIEPASSGPGFYSRLFVTPKVTGGWRPVIDLSFLNRFVRLSHFRMETAQSVLQSLRSGDWLISLDLQDAYLQVPVHPQSRRFLHVMAPVSSTMHRSVYRILRYLDDWLVLGSSQLEITRARDFLLRLCSDLGIQINLSKSSLQSTQRLDYLGMTLESAPLRAFPTQARIQKVLCLVDEFSSSPEHPLSLWRSLLGVMSFLSTLIPGSRLRMQSLQHRLLVSRPLDSPTASVSWDASCRRDHQWWSVPSHLGVAVDLSLPRPDLVLYTDASDSGWGASLGSDHLSGWWSRDVSLYSIKHRELLAVFLAARGALFFLCRGTNIYNFLGCVRISRHVPRLCILFNFFYPISTLHEHLHSTFPSHAKLPENTLTEKKNIPFPSLTLITCLTGPPVTPPPFTGRPSHTLSYTTILFLALKVNGRFLESLPVVTFASLELKLPVFSFH